MQLFIIHYKCIFIYLYVVYIIHNQFLYLQRNTVNIQYGSHNNIYIMVFRKENFSFKCIVKLKNKSD